MVHSVPPLGSEGHTVAKRPCLDCHLPTTGTRCPACTTRANVHRGSAAQRGYDAEWRRLVARVLVRDRWVCHICGRPGADSGDHVVPLSRGGARLEAGNVRAAHLGCNSAKGNKV